MTRLRFGLRARIIAWSFGPTMLILGAVAIYSLLTYLRVTTDLVEDRNQQMTQLVAMQISTEMTRYVDLLNELAMDPQILTFEPAHQATALRWSMGKLRPFDAGVVVLDEQGRVVATDPRRPELLGADWSRKRFFERLLMPTSWMFASDVEDLGPNDGPAIAFCLHLTDAHGNFRGAVVGLFALDTDLISDLYRGLSRSAMTSSESHTLLVDSAGQLIDPSREMATGLDLSKRPAVQRVMQGQSGALRDEDFWGRTMVVSYAPVPDTPWGLIQEQNWREISATSRAFGQRLFGLLAVGLATPALLVGLNMKRILRPVAQMKDAARRMAAGELDQIIVSPPGDELADLSDAFNHMSQRLQHLYANLEAQVLQRTHELRTLNTIARSASRSLDLRQTLESALVETLAALQAEAGLIYYARQGIDQQVQVARGLPDALAQQMTAATLITSPDDAMPTGQVRVPLIAQGQRVGGLILHVTSDRALSQSEMDLLDAIGQQVGVAADNARLYEQAEQIAVAAERNRLARELHDSVTQTLFSANLIAGVLPLLWDGDQREGRARLEELQELTRGALAEMRMLLLELRPSAMRGVSLRDLLQQLCDAVAARAQLSITCRFEGNDALPEDVHIALYRVAQEALNNVVKHSRATALSVELVFEVECVRVMCSDNGEGFEPRQVDAGHMGLRIMRERMAAIGGDLKITSVPGQGTEIVAAWRRCRPEQGEQHG